MKTSLTGTLRVKTETSLKTKVVKRILVIEDSLFIRENAAYMLETAGYEVFEAENGKIGLSIVKTILPDLVICDIMMPYLDGYGVLEGILADAETSKIPFIFLTAKTSKTEEELGLEMGAVAFITKPFNEFSLLKTVAIYLEK
jgi:DNA-binding response OmpR family regulator